MNEGAATLLPDGTIYYCNGRLAERLGQPPGTHRHLAAPLRGARRPAGL